MANSANLNQWVKIWTHNIDPAAIADPFYQDFQLNYSTADYITYNKTTLDSLHCPVPLDEINDNRLLIVLEDEITFIYEEVTLETIH